MPLVSIPVRTAVIALPGARVMISPGSRLTPEALRDREEVQTGFQGQGRERTYTRGVEVGAESGVGEGEGERRARSKEVEGGRLRGGGFRRSCSREEWPRAVRLQEGQLRRPGGERAQPGRVRGQAELLASDVRVGDDGEDGPAAAAGASENVVLENPAQKSSPVQARMAGAARAPGVGGLARCWRGHEREAAARDDVAPPLRVGREDAEEPRQVDAGLHHQGAQALHQLQRRQHQRAGAVGGRPFDRLRTCFLRRYSSLPSSRRVSRSRQMGPRPPYLQARSSASRSFSWR